MNRSTLACFLFVCLHALGVQAASLEEVSRLIDEGHWQRARLEIESALAQPGLDFQAREAWQFQTDRMARMRMDFNKTRAQVLQEAQRLVPAMTGEMFDGWEKEGALESMEIDGERWYFDRAAGNMFRIHSEAKALKIKTASAPKNPYRLEDIQRILADYDKTGEPLNTPKTVRITYTLTIKSNTVPPGEMIRAWLPVPVMGARQSDVRLISTDPQLFVRAGSSGPLSSIYLEKSAAAGEPTRFKLVVEYTTTAFYRPIDPARVQPISSNLTVLKPFLVEQPPHLVFTEQLKKLSREIIGDEKNPYLKARRIFQWIDEHIPWAGAREYSTLQCLPQYALTCRHGDCGIQTMLFMTLCRFNGIPARWESGWTTGPDRNMHDWCEIYLEPYGWVPADASYGLVKSDNEREKWFYLGGIDSHRLVVNTDHSQPLYPAKIFFRSEIVDFQRGEVEWRGGNLYFNQWSWDFRVEELEARNTGR